MASQPSPAMQALLEQFRGQSKPEDSRPIAEQRASLDSYMSGKPLPRGVETDDLRLAGRPARCHLPAGGAEDRGILYLHGGGYTVGSLDSHKALMAWLAHHSQAAVYGLDYRLAPEHPFPAALDDAVAAFTELAARFAAERLMIAGDSAGGGLALACLLALKDQGLPLPACAAVMSPATDLSGASAQGAAKTAAYANGKPLRTPGLSPLYGDLLGLPPILIQVASDELLTNDSTRFAKRAKESGVPVELQTFPNAFHVFQMFTELPEAQAALADIGKFFSRHVANHSPALRQTAAVGGTTGAAFNNNSPRRGGVRQCVAVAGGGARDDSDHYDERPPSLHNSPRRGGVRQCVAVAGGGATTVASASGCATGAASALGPPTPNATRWATPPQGGSD